MRTATVVMAAVATLFSAAGSAQAPTPPVSVVDMAPEARSYLDRAITHFRSMHINASRMDWPAVTAQAYAVAAGAKTSADTYPAIRSIIETLGEKHTFLITPDKAKAQSTGKASNGVEAPPLLLPESAELSNGIGMIRLYGFNGSEEQGRQYAAVGQARIAALQSRGICKFIVDLRPNTGGNMYPMIDAVGGLLDDGILGTFENAAGQLTHWVLEDGKTGTRAVVATGPASSGPSRNSASVAVLIGPSTASAGEYTAMAFKGRANTRFFGSPSGGWITANRPVPLSDGAVILMTGAWGIDRTGKKYVDRLEPDEMTGAGGPALDAAETWLARQTCDAATGQKTR